MQESPRQAHCSESACTFKHQLAQPLLRQCLKIVTGKANRQKGSLQIHSCVTSKQRSATCCRGVWTQQTLACCSSRTRSGTVAGHAAVSTVCHVLPTVSVLSVNMGRGLGRCELITHLSSASRAYLCLTLLFLFFCLVRTRIELIGMSLSRKWGFHLDCTELYRQSKTNCIYHI